MLKVRVSRAVTPVWTFVAEIWIVWVKGTAFGKAYRKETSYCGLAEVVSPVIETSDTAATVPACTCDSVNVTWFDSPGSRVKVTPLGGTLVTLKLIVGLSDSTGAGCNPPFPAASGLVGSIPAGALMTADTETLSSAAYASTMP